MMNKTVVRIILLLLAGLLIFSCIYPVFAAELDEEEMTAGSIMLLDAETGAILYEKNADAQRAPASTTKLMTAMVALENLELDREVTVPAKAQTSGSSMGLKPGQVVTVESLLYGLMLNSGNDAAVTLAIETAGTVAEFAAMMNAKAKALGMNNTNFVTASGLDEEGHYVTVRDMSLLALHVYENELMRQIMATEKATCYTVDKTTAFPLENSNMLLHTPSINGEGKPYDGPTFLYEYATGMKTGSTYQAKGCLVASAEKDGRTLIALVFGDDSEHERDRWKIAKTLFDYGFTAYKNVNISELIGGNVYLDVVGGPIVNGEAMKLECMPVAADGSPMLTLPAETDLSAIQHTVTPSSTGLSAPIKEGTEVGEILVSHNGAVLMNGKLVAAEAMMTTEEYEKLSGNKSDPSDALNQDAEKRENLRKYAWLWLLLPVIGVGAVLFMMRRANTYSHRRGGRGSARLAAPAAGMRSRKQPEKQGRPVRKPAPQITARRQAVTVRRSGAHTGRTSSVRRSAGGVVSGARSNIRRSGSAAPARRPTQPGRTTRPRR